MKKIAVLFANGTEEIEALTPVDVLKRAGATVDIISVNGELVTGSHGITIKANKLINDFHIEEYDAVVIPGGKQGSINLSNDKKVIAEIEKGIALKKLICSICASPAVVLGSHNLINKKRATCYPADVFIDVLKDKAIYTGKAVEIDENLITADGIKSAMEFSIEIAKNLGLTPQF